MAERGGVGGMGGEADPELKRGHGLAGNPACGPSRLKVIASGDPVDIESFPGKVEVRDEAALHGFCIYLVQGNASAGDKLLFVHAFAADRELGRGEDLNQTVGGLAAEFGPAILRSDAGEESELRPKTAGQRGPF